jgi:hypothetical protein
MWVVILRITLVGGSMLLWRHFQTYIWLVITIFFDDHCCAISTTCNE